MAVTPDADTMVIFSREAEGPQCSVCLGAGPNPTCNSDLTLREPLNTTIQFTCDKPEDIYKVEINREFGELCLFLLALPLVPCRGLL